MMCGDPHRYIKEIRQTEEALQRVISEKDTIEVGLCSILFRMRRVSKVVQNNPIRMFPVNRWRFVRLLLTTTAVVKRNAAAELD